MVDAPNPALVVLGLMSGTSLDGIDAALIATDGETVAAFGPARTVPYGAAARARIRAVFGRADRDADEVRAAERELTDLHAAAIADLLTGAPPEWRGVGLIGFHGQTLFHAPDRGVTVQIGDGARLARITGVPVVSDFRSRDVAAGGQGAPLVPAYHRALVAAWRDRPSGAVAVLNVGGVANLTLVTEDGGMLAFDTGPGNALLDDWAALHTGQPCDVDGALASRGRIDEAWLAAALDHPYFRLPPPKSLDRNAFVPPPPDRMSAADGAATLAALTVRAVGLARDRLPEIPAAWVVCGGGRRNPVLMAGFAAELGTPVIAAEDAGWDGDALEAQAFAFLAARARRGLPYSYPGTTGVAAPVCGGRIDLPPD